MLMVLNELVSAHEDHEKYTVTLAVVKGSGGDVKRCSMRHEYRCNILVTSVRARSVPEADEQQVKKDMLEERTPERALLVVGGRESP